MKLIQPGKAHVNDHTTPLSTLGLDPVCVFGHLFHRVEPACRRPGQSGRRIAVPVGLFRVPGAAGTGDDGRF